MPDAARTAGPRPAEGIWTRPVVAAVLLLITGVSLGLRLWEFRFALPNVLHSDYIQVTQAAQFLRDGTFVERSSYPVTHTWAYVAADVLAFALDRVFGFGGWAGWDEFVRELQSPGLHHAIGRVYTAIVGAWLGMGVYLLARVRFPRGTALLAAAIASFCPAFVLYSHQVRIHVPGITLLAFAAVPLMRLVFGRGRAGRAAPPAAAEGRAAPDWRLALLAGAAAGTVASVFQLGFVLLAVGGLMLLCLRRPFRALLVEGVLVAAAFGAAFFLISGISHWPGLVTDPPGHEVLQDAATLGIPGATIGFHFGNRFPDFVRNYVLAEPVRALAVLLLLVACVRGRRSWRDVVAFGLYPAVMFVLLGTNYTDVRYSMSATVFLAPLAAAGCLALRSAGARAALAAALLLAPLASSVRADLLLAQVDSRVSLERMLHELPAAGATVVVESALVMNPDALPDHVVQFPPEGNFKPWFMDGVAPRDTLRELQPAVFVRTRGDTLHGRLPPEVLERMGYWRCAVVDTGADVWVNLPDAPQDLVIELWRVRRPGPPLEIWSRTPQAQDEVYKLAHDHGLLALARWLSRALHALGRTAGERA